MLTTLCSNRVSLSFWVPGRLHTMVVTLLVIICLISRVLILRSNKVLHPRLGLTIQKWKKPRGILVNIHCGLFTPPEYFSDFQRIGERRTCRECRHSTEVQSTALFDACETWLFSTLPQPSPPSLQLSLPPLKFTSQGRGGDLKGRGPSASLPVSPKPCSAWAFLPPPTLCAFCSPF